VKNKRLDSRNEKEVETIVSSHFLGSNMIRKMKWKCCRFFCALHPDMRERWAQGWGRRIKQGGALIALAFPVTEGAPAMSGPPFPVQVEDYRKVLEPQGFTCIDVLPVEKECATTPQRAGLETMTVWLKVE
jgi:hypothetical protein